MPTDLTVDASVWVAAVDQLDAFHDESQLFLAAVSVQGIRLIVPAFVDAEVACAVARKFRDPEAGRTLSQDILQANGVVYVNIDTAMIEAAIRVGTAAFLRGADALYAA